MPPAARPPPRPAVRPVGPPPRAALPPPREHVGFSVSGIELVHLVVSVAVLSVAFAIAFSHPPGFFDLRLPTSAEWDLALQIMPGVVVLVVLGFLLHEMAHKVVAQRLQLWAEFRASAGGLAAALGFALFTPFLFAAPGAVVITGNATRRDGAYISIAGPTVNIVIGFLMLPFARSAANPVELGQVGNFFELAVAINALLAVFNLLPVRPLDGSKIVRWSIPVYLGMLALALVLFYIGVVKAI